MLLEKNREGELKKRRRQNKRQKDKEGQEGTGEGTRN